ncbi:hypothetical protein [Tautonia marina]|uniref:hypothetical protein n=1 Tax=Tautonia marina TaxID=2653855 RepID=UPI0012611887|nr:hypothetical protein [Tautonia marina]
MSDASNPYLAPESPMIDRPADLSRPRKGTPGLLVGWVIVFLVNLPIPVMFGSALTEGNARIGMTVGTVALGLVGGLFCQRSYRIALALTAGGVAVAITQVIAIPQFIAGSIGLMVSTTLGLADPNFDVGSNEMTLWSGGLVTTLVTGSLLMGLALGIGLLFQLLGFGGGSVQTVEKPPTLE